MFFSNPKHHFKLFFFKSKFQNLSNTLHESTLDQPFRNVHKTATTNKQNCFLKTGINKQTNKVKIKHFSSLELIDRQNMFYKRKNSQYQFNALKQTNRIILLKARRNKKLTVSYFRFNIKEFYKTSIRLVYIKKTLFICSNLQVFTNCY